MSYVGYIDDYYRRLYDIDNTLSNIESGFAKIGFLRGKDNQVNNLDDEIWGLENVTIESCEELYPYDDPDEKLIDYDNLLNLYKNRLKRYLDLAYAQGEWNVIHRSQYYEALGMNGPSIEMLRLLPIDYGRVAGYTPELRYKYAFDDVEIEKRINLFLAARDGYEPALRAVKEIYGWERENIIK